MNVASKCDEADDVPPKNLTIFVRAPDETILPFCKLLCAWFYNSKRNDGIRLTVKDYNTTSAVKDVIVRPGWRLFSERTTRSARRGSGCGDSGSCVFVRNELLPFSLGFKNVPRNLAPSGGAGVDESCVFVMRALEGPVFWCRPSRK